MDALTATVEIIKALAWPVVALIILVMFRKPILGIIPFIQNLKLPGVEVTIARQIAEAKALIQESPTIEASQKNIVAVETSKKEKLLQIAWLAPRAAISEAWRELELAGANAANAFSTKGKKSPKFIRSPASFAEALQNENLISENQRQAISMLRKIRNEAVHLAEFSLDHNVVHDYVETAFKLVKEIEAINPRD